MEQVNGINFRLEAVLKENNEQQDFEGPLSLILQLLNKNKIEIKDIRISDILDQYLDYVDKMQILDLDSASEFVQMASYLVYIKTRMMLSGDAPEPELDALIASLEQLKSKQILEQVKVVLTGLVEMYDRGKLIHTKPPEIISTSKDACTVSVQPIQLLKAICNVYLREKKTAQPAEAFSKIIAPTKIQYSVKLKSHQLVSTLKSGSVKLSGLYAQCSSRTEVVATFLSVLELCSAGNLEVDFDGEEYYVRLVDSNIDEIIEKMSE